MFPNIHSLYNRIFTECSNEQSFMHFLYHEIDRKIEQIDVFTNNYFCRVNMLFADIFVTWPCTYINKFINYTR